MKYIVDKAETRGYFDHGWLKTYHTFSFADYYNPGRMQFGALRVLNDDTVAPGKGFGMHPHNNMEVVSIPLQGYLRHGDNVKNERTITPGEIQVMSTGSGMFHSEYNGSMTEVLKFLQIWVVPGVRNTEPKYHNYDIRPFLKHNELCTFISPEGGETPAHLLQDAWFSMGTFDAGQEITYRLNKKIPECIFLCWKAASMYRMFHFLVAMASGCGKWRKLRSGPFPVQASWPSKSP